MGKMRDECVMVKEGGGDVGRAHLSSSRMASTISLT